MTLQSALFVLYLATVLDSNAYGDESEKLLKTAQDGHKKSRDAIQQIPW